MPTNDAKRAERMARAYAERHTYDLSHVWAVPEPWEYAYRPPYLSEAQGSLPRASASRGV